MNDKLSDFVFWLAIIIMLYAAWRLITIDWDSDDNRSTSPINSPCNRRIDYHNTPVKLEHEIPSVEKACIAVGICDELTLGYLYDTKLVNGWRENIINNASRVFEIKKAPSSSGNAKKKAGGKKK